ncbi:hypothetical protein HAX54_018582 [Datura stramonium]|uniref:Uncharacterized protein n=1 Tax=Datura stramonium TaxID=4076 RepID=A0ABS8S1J8_DATST|nr:hypothetical protein [Datura stramonium]
MIPNSPRHNTSPKGPLGAVELIQEAGLSHWASPLLLLGIQHFNGLFEWGLLQWASDPDLHPALDPTHLTTSNSNVINLLDYKTKVGVAGEEQAWRPLLSVFETSAAGRNGCKRSFSEEHEYVLINAFRCLVKLLVVEKSEMQ